MAERDIEMSYEIERLNDLLLISYKIANHHLIEIHSL